jgi:uncharacterized protein (DUF2062 family)
MSLQAAERLCSKAVAELTNFFRRRVVGPVLQLLRYGGTPERLAWSIAVGVVVGVNPLLGSTTALALVVASGFRLNVVASQFGNHLVYPLELLLFPVFIRLGSLLFRTKGLPLELRAIRGAVKAHPWDTTKLLWSWEWHALVVWAAIAVVATPVLKFALKPVLEKMLDKLHHEPVVEK